VPGIGEAVPLAVKLRAIMGPARMSQVRIGSSEQQIKHPKKGWPREASHDPD